MKSKIVEFKKIKVKNFLSYGNSPIELEFKNGITFVSGFNKDDNSYNGVGKTSLIVESISFLLFGETYREINMKDIKHEFATKKEDCVVEGWLTVDGDELHIVRSIGPSVLRLSVNGNSDLHTRSIAETTKDIMERIGISKTVFTNTIVMTNKDSMSFMNQKKDAKVKFIEGILNLEAFTPFLKLAKEDVQEVEGRRSKKFQEVTLTEKSLEADKSFSQRHEERQKQEISSLETKIEILKSCQPVDNSGAIEELQEKKVQFQAEIEEKSPKIEKATEKKNNLSYDLKRQKEDLFQLSGKQAACPSCKRPYEDHNPEELEKEKCLLREKINSLAEQVEKFEKAIAKVQNEISDAKRNVRDVDYKVNALVKEQEKFIKSQSEIESVIKELARVQNASNPFIEKLKETEEKLAACKLELDEIVHESVLANAIKDLASPTGVKAIVIKQVIDSLNARINHYLSRLRSPYIVKFDEFFEETFTSKKTGREYSYGSLSGGEARRADFAMLFAFRDIRRLRSNVHINITVMDELFDSALCEHGMQSIMDMLKESTNESFLIVTHRPQNVEIFDCNMIKLIKENGITRLNDSD